MRWNPEPYWEFFERMLAPEVLTTCQNHMFPAGLHEGQRDEVPVDRPAPSPQDAKRRQAERWFKGLDELLSWQGQLQRRRQRGKRRR